MPRHLPVVVVLAGLGCNVRLGPAADDAGDDAPGTRADAGPDDPGADASPTACTTCAIGGVTAAGTIASAELVELSGLAASRALPILWAHNDSGDTARVFALGLDGAALGTLVLPGATAIDWEDVAAAPCDAGTCLYVADTGDNDGDRATVAIYEVVEPAAAPTATLQAVWRRFELTYPDGPHNVEALAIDPRDRTAYVITKVDAGPAAVYATALASGAFTRVGELVIPSGTPRVTAADLDADACGVRLLVRTYDALFELRAGPDASIAALLARPLVPRPVAAEAKGEAVAYLPGDAGYVTAPEGSSPVLSTGRCDAL